MPDQLSRPSPTHGGRSAAGDVLSLLRAYSNLDRKRVESALSVEELDEWSRLKRLLDRRLSGGAPGARERRGSPRVPTRLRCEFASRGALSEALITNLSTGGVFIATKTPLPIGSKLRLVIQVEESGASAELNGEVVSTGLGPDGTGRSPGMGVRFTGLAAETTAQIKALYAHEVERACAERRD